ncbi:MAG: hypothetical protein OEZ09_17355 [Betaproteobacteria bacterium]|nr:hypothetical protein [Betaproteobacteria bacterium]
MFFGVVELVIIFYLTLPPLVIVASIISYAIGVVVLYATVLRLKRVECAEDFLYVTNYFKTYRYSYESIASTRTTHLLIAQIVTVRFRDRTSFGRRIYFIKRPNVWAEQGLIHPELRRQG